MALPFVAGAMNALWIAFLTLAVLWEKALPFGQSVSRALGITALV